MSAPDIPTNYTVTTTLGGAVDFGLDDIRIKQIPKITLASDSTVDLGLDDIRIKELPTIDLRVQGSMKPTRVHFPTNLKFGICSFGTELLSLTICGESMVVVEDYHPHATEDCA